KLSQPCVFLFLKAPSFAWMTKRRLRIRNGLARCTSQLPSAYVGCHEVNRGPSEYWMCACLRDLQGIKGPHGNHLLWAQLILGEHLIHVLDKALSLPCFHS